MPQTKEQRRISYLKNAEAIREKRRIYRLQNPEKVRESNRRYENKNKEKVAEWSKKSRAKNRDRCRTYWLEYYRTHKEESAERMRAWAKANPEKVAALSKARRERDLEAARAKEKHWRDSNPEAVALRQRRRKMKKMGNSTPDEICAADSTIKKARSIPITACAYCSAFFVTSEMHVDHVIPVSKGGKHAPENILIACAPCNQSKSDKPLWREWIPSNPRACALMFKVFAPVSESSEDEHQTEP